MDKAPVRKDLKGYPNKTPADKYFIKTYSLDDDLHGLSMDEDAIVNEALTQDVAYKIGVAPRVHQYGTCNNGDQVYHNGSSTW